MSAARTFNLADLFEITAHAIPERIAVVADGTAYTYDQLDRRASQVGHHLIASGVEPGQHVAIIAWNRIEWLEAFLGCFKARVVPININYRYTPAEMAQVLGDAEAVAVVVEHAFVDGLTGVRDQLPQLRHVIGLADGTTLADPAAVDVDYHQAVAQAPDDATFGPRSGDDRYLIYTGGTTGAPKGVVWRSEDLFFAALAGGRPGGDPIERPEELAEALAPDRRPWLVTSPLMHGNGQWNSLSPLLTGQGVVLWTGRRFDGHAVAALAADERAALLVLVGDGMALPFLDALDAGRPDEAGATAPYDLSKLRMIASGGAILSPVCKERLAHHLPRVMVLDGFGASETGTSGRLAGSGDGGPPRFQMGPDSAVLGEDLRPVAVGEVGRLARRGHVPLGYWRDEAKTAATFPTDPDGVRWAIPGDMARPEADGTITVLGRGSTSINTGGEKVHPEEVSAVIKSHPDVVDAFVVGAPDPRFGQQVVAIVQARAGATLVLDDVRDHVRTQLAGYKAPRRLIVVDSTRYTPQGKPDLRWAADVVAADDSAQRDGAPDRGEDRS